MHKKLTVILFASLVALSATQTFASDDDDDFTVPSPPNQRVPDVTSTLMLAGYAVSGLAATRVFLRKRR